MKTGNTYHTTATPIRLTDPEIRSILAASLRHIRRRVKPTPPDGWCPVVGVYTSTAVDPRTGEAMPGPEIDALKSALAQAGQGGGTQP